MSSDSDIAPVIDAIPSSLKARRTFNPIRHVVDNLKPSPTHPMSLLNLALGDPTAFGNLQCPTVLSEAVQDLLRYKFHVC